MEWILVRGFKPKFNQHVLVYCTLWGIYPAYYEQISDSDYGQWKDFNGRISIPPKYWMPFPNPPEL